VIQVANCLALCHGAVAQPSKLREDEPHPVGLLVSHRQFFDELATHESWASRKRTRSGSVIRVRRHRWASLAKIAPFVRPSTKRSCENFAIHRRMQRGRLGRGPTVDTRRSYYLAPRQDDFAEALAGIHKPQSCEILCATSANDNSPWKPRLSARVWTLFRHLVAMHRPAG
jgi:hypothetical protein